MQPILEAACALFMTMQVPQVYNWKWKLWYTSTIHLLHRTRDPVTFPVYFTVKQFL